jgi:hypothetical protein
MPTQEPTHEEIVSKTLDLLERPDITHPADLMSLMTVLVGYFQMGRNTPCPDASQVWGRAVPHLLAYRDFDPESLERQEFPEGSLGAWMKQALRDELRRRAANSEQV